MEWTGRVAATGGAARPEAITPKLSARVENPGYGVPGARPRRRWTVGKTDRIKELFLRVVELDEAERNKILEAECAGDSRSLDRVRELLELHDGRSDVVERALEHEVGSLRAALHGDGLVVPDQLGEYTLAECIGTGGMGKVYRATRRGDGMVVAVKVVRAPFLSTDLTRQFHREMRALRKLDHPGIVKLLDSGEFRGADGLRPYIVMEMVEGRSLAEFVGRETLVYSQRITLLADICDVVCYAHDSGVVHRDLKPDNILVEENGQPRILDFGVARVRDSTTSHTNALGHLFGTVQYMSPEQARGATREIDHRCDIYSLGVIGFELLTGALPYDVTVGGIANALKMVVQTPAPAIMDIHPSLPRNLDVVIQRALAKKSADRYENAGEMARDLRRVLAGIHVGGKRSGRLSRAAHWIRRHRVGVGVAGLIVTGGVVAATIGARVVSENRRVIAERDAREDTFLAELDNTERLFAEERRDVARVEDLIQRYHRADAQVWMIEHRPYWRDVKRLVSFRLGTCYSLHGVQTRSRGDFELSAKHHEEGFAVKPIDGARDEMARNHYTWMTARIDDYFFLAGIGDAWASLSAFATPVANLERAVSYQDDAIRSYAKKWNLEGDLDKLQTGRFRYAELLHSAGNARWRLGYAADRIDAIDDGIRFLRSALSVEEISRAVPQCGSIRHSLAAAYARRGALAGDGADFDSSLAIFNRALSIRTETARPQSHAESIEELARAEYLFATRCPDAGTARRLDLLNDAYRMLETARHLENGSGAITLTRIAALAASVQAERSALRRSADKERECLDVLRASADVFSRAGAPVEHASILVRRARARWVFERLRSRRGTETGAVPSMALLDEAEGMFARNEFPRLAREIRELRNGIATWSSRASHP